MNEKIYDVLIIGGGPAGFTAAIYTSRAQLSTLCLSGPIGMGQLESTSEVENFPGFPEGVMGPTLIADMKKQAERFGTKMIDEYAAEISGSSEEKFIVKTESGKVFKGRSVIISTGASARWLGLESEQKLRGRGVSACATCDGFFFKDKVVAVIGGGDSAMEEATYLAKFASKVYIIVMEAKEEMFASKYMADKAFSNEKIEFFFNTEVKEVLGENKVEGIKVFSNISDDEKILDVEGMFLAIGRIPNTKFLNGFVDLDRRGFVKVEEGTKTSKEGVFAAGDVADPKYMQAIVAAGSGCMASLDVEKYLSHKN